MFIINQKWDNFWKEVKEAYFKSHETAYDVFKESAINTSSIILTVYWLILAFLWIFLDTNDLNPYWKLALICIILLIILEILIRNFWILPVLQSLANENKSFYLGKWNLYREKINLITFSQDENIENASNNILIQCYKELEDWSREISEKISETEWQLYCYRKIISIIISIYLIFLILNLI